MAKQKSENFPIYSSKKQIEDILGKRSGAETWRQFIARRTRLIRDHPEWGHFKAWIRAAIEVAPNHPDLTAMHSEWVRQGSPDKPIPPGKNSSTPFANLAGTVHDYAEPSPDGEPAVLAIGGESIVAPVRRKAVRTGMPEVPLPERVTEIPKERRSSPKENVEYVAESILLPDDELEPSLAPSRTAWGMLMFFRAGAGNQSKFWNDTYVRILPTKSEIEREGSAAAGAQFVDNKIERIINTLEMLEAEEMAAPAEVTG